MPTIQEFMNFEFKTAKIVEALDHPNADKLVVLKIDTGVRDESGNPVLKQIVAGIRKVYTNEELVGKTIVVIDNLDPAVLRGVESNGMLLAATDESGQPILISPERPVNAGARVK